MLDAWFAKYGLGKLPKIIFGISSGAAFAIKFPRTFPGLAGVVSGEQCVQPCTWETQLAGGRCKAVAARLLLPFLWLLVVPQRSSQHRSLLTPALQR